MRVRIVQRMADESISLREGDVTVSAIPSGERPVRMKTDPTITAASLSSAADRVFALAAEKVRLIDRTWDVSKGTPVFTVEGRYTTRGWTEWTQGFQYGLAILAFDATDERELLELGRTKTLQRLAAHVTHTGVHDHGFNNISTYGNLRRLMREERMPHNEWEQNFY